MTSTYENYKVYSHGNKTRLSCSIRYDGAAIAAIKALPGAKYYRDAKRWYVDYSAASQAALKTICADAWTRYLDSLPGQTGNSFDQEDADERALNGGQR